MRLALVVLCLSVAGCSWQPVPVASYWRCWPAWPLPEPPVIVV